MDPNAVSVLRRFLVTAGEVWDITQASIFNITVTVDWNNNAQFTIEFPWFWGEQSPNSDALECCRMGDGEPVESLCVRRACSRTMQLCVIAYYCSSLSRAWVTDPVMSLLHPIVVRCTWSAWTTACLCRSEDSTHPRHGHPLMST